MFFSSLDIDGNFWRSNSNLFVTVVLCFMDSVTGISEAFLYHYLPMIFTSLSQYSVGDLECKVQCIFHFLLHFMIESNSNAQWLVTNITIVIRLSQIFVRLFTDLFALAMICTFSHMICLTVRFGKVLSNILDVSKVLIN